MNKKIIVLRGVACNFKSSILRSPYFKDFAKVPEGNRALEKELEKLEQKSTTDINFCHKKLLIQAYLNASSENRFIFDRCLVDYGLMSEFIKTTLLDYLGSESKLLTPEKAFEEELKVLNGYQVINVLLRTYDETFLHKCIDDSFDTRGVFFGFTEDYLKCQEIYSNFILSHFNNVKVFDFNHVPTAQGDLEKLIDKTAAEIYEELNK